MNNLLVLTPPRRRQFKAEATPFIFRYLPTPFSIALGKLPGIIFSSVASLEPFCHEN
jgi:hypothetical protein